ncbi:maleylacetoacetate isomerase [Janthinobacterium sp. 67]|uniref:maleylacetoacetate isomerase n=1 Tax=Janthinobacterium sp. 67 TaxID=2035207 RepID=UPI000C23D012|nr:maleylacetoacetate isomerase [Janthinobacterium sp. 67]PJJ06674.1 maleylacetoacetate isomerase [Janthinobacterium sp. 67]
MKLYSFFNSSTSYRVRIALALKGLPYDYAGVNLRGGEQGQDAYRALSPAGIVPVLVDGDTSMTQSLAIIDYLDRQYPEPRLIPDDSLLRARVLEIAQTIACEIHPINNIRVLKYLSGKLGVTEEAKNDWYKHWVDEGLAAVEQLLAQLPAGPYCAGDQPTLADCCLVPQVANAMRMGCDLTRFTRILAIYEHCVAQPAFILAAPANQPDYIG